MTCILTFQFLGFSKVEIGVTSDGKTIVCHHPGVDIPYELTQVSAVYLISEVFWIVLDLFLLHNKQFKCHRLTVIKKDVHVTVQHIMSVKANRLPENTVYLQNGKLIFAAYRKTRPPCQPTRDARSGVKGPPQQGGAQGQKGPHYRGAGQDVFHYETPLLSSWTVS